MSSFKVLSLFSGIGGFELGIYCANLQHLFEPAHFVEVDKYCQSILNKWFPTVPITSLIQDFKAEAEYDIITAGFPCQPHSLAGSRKGTNDSRDLWTETIETIKAVKPKAFILENVPGLRYTHEGDFFKRVLRDIADAGYDAEWSHHTVREVGGVHKRSRIFIIAYPSGKRCGCRSSNWQKRQLQSNEYGQHSQNKPKREGRQHRLREICTTENSLSERQSRSPSGSQARAIDASTSTSTTPLSSWAQIESTFCRVDDGFSSGMDWLLTEEDLDFALERAADDKEKPLRKHQIKALGNAICPQQCSKVWLRLNDILNNI